PEHGQLPDGGLPPGASVMISKFRRGSSTFTCEGCGKLTRDTGVQGIGMGLCPYCYEVGGLENSLDDGEITPEQFEAGKAELQKRYKHN
ncbi:hypothetical protein RZS08_15755, partial [Arthrospira platensis SPKY1]|nr:hypothetical protein [Arthrospira platensis SPKY1]